MDTVTDTVLAAVMEQLGFKSPAPQPGSITDLLGWIFCRRLKGFKGSVSNTHPAAVAQRMPPELA